MLIKYEFLKILRKKSTIIIMAASFILTTLLFGIQIIQYQVYNENGVIKGPAGIAYEKEQYKDLSVSLSEEYITKTILEVQQLFKNPDNIGYDGNEQFLIGDAYWNSIAPREKLLNTISKAYDSPDGTLGYNKFRNLDIKNGANFYQAVKLKLYWMTHLAIYLSAKKNIGAVWQKKQIPHFNMDIMEAGKLL